MDVCESWLINPITTHIFVPEQTEERLVPQLDQTCSEKWWQILWTDIPLTSLILPPPLMRYSINTAWWLLSDQGSYTLKSPLSKVPRSLRLISVLTCLLAWPCSHSNPFLLIKQSTTASSWVQTLQSSNAGSSTNTISWQTRLLPNPLGIMTKLKWCKLKSCLVMALKWLFLHFVYFLISSTWCLFHMHV